MSARPHRVAGPAGLGVLLACLLLIGGVGRSLAQLGPPALVANVGHAGDVNSVAFSPDGRFAASASNDLSIKLWEVQTGRELRTLTGHRGFVMGVAFSPDGRRLVSGDFDGAVKLWDMASGRELRSFPGHTDAVFAVAFSPDGRLFASASDDGSVKLWDPARAAAEATLRGQGGKVRSVAFSPDGRMLASGSTDRTLKLWDVARRQETKTLSGGNAGVLALSFSPDGGTLVSNGRSRLVLWDVARGRVRTTIPWRRDAGVGVEDLWTVAFSPDGRTIAAGGTDKVVRLFDAATGRELRASEAQAGTISKVAYSPDGGRLVSASGPEVALWDVASARKLRSLPGEGGSIVHGVALSPDGLTVASASGDSTVHVWDLASGRQVRRLAGHTGAVSAVAFSRDGRTLVSGSSDGSLKLWDTSSGAELRSFDGNKTPIRSVLLTPDGRSIMSGADEGRFLIWDVETARQRRVVNHGNWGADRLAMSPDGGTIASGVGEIRLWDAAGNGLRSLPRYAGSAVAFSPDGRTIASSGTRTQTDPHTIDLVNATDGAVGRSIGRHADWITTITFSPDGRTILSGSEDRTLKLWDVESGRELATFSGHGGVIESAAFSPDGRTIVSGSRDNTTRVWSASGTLLATLFGSRSEWLAITPEGFFVASPNGAKLLHVARGLETSSIDQVYDALHRPDLVREKLAGDPRGLVRAAAARLDLDKVIASGAPPRVAITGPAGGSSVPDQVTVEANVTDAGGGIGRVEWRVNDVTQGVQARGFDRRDAAPAGASQAERPAGLALRQTLQLRAGENRIDLRVYNAAGLIASEPVTLTVTRASVAPEPRLFVLAAGIDAYDDDALRLSYSGADARALGAALRTNGTRLYRSVEVTTLLDKDVTAAGLDAAFARLGREIAPDDVFVFYVAGHGKTVDGRYHFLPRDFRYDGEGSIAKAGIGQDRWQDWFRRIPAQKSVLLFDTCESGALTGEGIATRGLEAKTALDFLTRATGRTTLTASTSTQLASEGYRGHGVFTYAVLDALGRGDSNGDDLVDMNELVTFVDREVPLISERAFRRQQFPQKAMFGSNFPLAGRQAVLSDAAAVAISVKPTHVVIAPADAYERPGGKGIFVQRLAPGTLVTLVRTEDGWVLLARDGKTVGYAAPAAVAAMQ